MATDSTNLPQGETTLDAGIDMAGSDLGLTTVQEAAATDPTNFVDLPKGNTVILLPVQPGQTVRLPTDSTDGLLAKIGPEGNLAIVVDGRTIILQGFLKANDQSPIKIVTNDGDAVDVAALVAATDQSLDIQTAAGPASGDQGDAADGSGIYIPFLAGPGLGGILAEGILDPTALQYRLIDDEYKEFPLNEEDPTPDFTITFDVLGGIVNEDDLPADEQLNEIAAKLVFKEGGNEGEGNDPFDGTDRDDNDDDGIPNESDDNANGADPDREPLSTVATVKVDFHGDVPGKLEIDVTKLPVGLTSEGEIISYAIDPAVAGVHGNGIFGYVENGGGAGYQDGIDRLVFEIHVDKDESDSEFKVTFTLHDNIDNEAPDENGDSQPDLLGANEQLLDLPVHFKITDSNGDAVGGTLPFQVEDDKPFFGEVVNVGENMQIVDTVAEVTHDETKGTQSDDGADDQSFFDFVPYPPFIEINFPLIAVAADLYDQVINQAGFSLPYGDSVGALLGAAQSQVKVSFGADAASQEHLKDIDDPSARESVFGAVSGTGENERPFELFMIDQNSVNGTVPVEDNKSTVADESNLTASPQKTNMTVTWNGEVLPVWLVQIDANTIVGYIEAESGGEQEAFVVPGIGAGKEAVLVIDINDAGVLSFFQLHQLNHPDTTNGDEQIQILAEDNETPLIYVRASDYDGDHAIQPVTVGIQDDKPRFIKVCYDENNGWVDEDELPTGNHDNQPGDNAGGTTTSGTIVFAIGADKPGTLTIDGLTITDSDGQVINFADLKTADGNGVTWSKSAPDLNGVVTWTAIENGSGDPAFTFTLDTAGPNQGAFTFTLNQALKHPYTDSDSNNDGPETAYEDDLNFGFNVVATDIDGDTASGNIIIKVDDDVPVFECVDFGGDRDSKNGVGLIDEDKLDPNGNHDWAPGDDKGGTHVDGTINFSFGADQPGTLTVGGLTVKDCADPANVILQVTIDALGNPVVTSGELRTADGQPIEIVKTGPDVNGIVTWQGIVAGSDPAQEAFKLTIDTVGDNIGDFDFCLSLPLEHPYQDSDSKNNGPEKSFEDNLKFDFTVIGTDADGDSATGHIKVNVDDDSPKAECDVDCVTEGKDGETLNFATGNVVTGDGDTIFGNDDNNLDGNQDSPGADQPYTISKISHDGVQYLLHTPEGGDPFVTKKVGAGPEEPLNGTTETFDSTTGILHIPTEEGGTLDIVMISDDQSQVGDYKYTVPENAQHEHDIHAGPETLAESLSDAFNTVGEWTSSFASKGITIVPLNGSLDIKSVNVSGPDDYRGIGVANFNGDEVEVDRGGNEGLRLNLANDVDNIALTIGALFDGTQYDAGHQEILEWKIYNNGILVGSGQILGDHDGVVTLDIDSPVPFDRVELKPINNGQGDTANNSDFLLINAEICCPKDKFTEEFDYTLRDADGDESCATLKVDVKDTEPTREHGQPFITAFVVDEDGLPTGVGNTNSPADDEENHSGPNAPVDDAVHFGTIPFTPGADPTSIELTVLGGPDTGMKTLDNQKIFAAWDAATQTLVGYIEGTDPNDAANQVFKMTILDPLTGSYSFELLQPVKHNNSDIGIDDNTENAFNTPANFVVVAEIEDKDCDVLFSKVLVTIDDDMPVITKTENTISLNVDETVGGNGTDFDDPVYPGAPQDGSTIENDEALVALPPALTNPAYGAVIGADEANGAALFGFNAGADQLQSAVYGLKITGGGTTGLIDTATGFSIKLVQNGNVIEGRADDGNGKTADPVVFAFTVDQGTGEVSMAQYRAINHGNEEGEFGAPDEVATMLSGKLAVTLAVTDKDGDTASASKDISGSITFDDDGPIVNKGTGTLTLALDETVSKSDADYDDLGFPNDGVQDGNAIEGDENFVALPAVLTALGTAIGAATGSSVGLFSVQPGSDGLASIKYFLQIGAGATGLTDTASQTPITLSFEGGVVKGKDGLGNLVFAISIDQNTGQVSVAQFRAVDHGDEEAAPGAHDEVAFLGQGSLSVVAIATDKDGDSDSETVDISHGISFDDDGPSANCDYDSVTEGAGNTATGNVVSGANPENPDLGTDLNGTDGNADQLSQDTPHTISKLTHGGHEYTLSADGLTILKDGGALGLGESFAGGKLTITTEEGATFEIIMVSSDPADVGEYKYTTGPNPIHAEDVHYGADSLAESITLAQGGVAGYAASFGPGITLEAIGGTLAVKTVDVNPKGGPLGVEDYGGIGVASSPGDEAEVDQLGQGEALKLNFATPTDNAEIQFGALFNGVQYDSGFQEIVKWEALAADGVTVIASGQILGVNNGLVVLDIDTDVPFSSIKLTPLNNGAGSNDKNSDFVILGVEVCNEEPVKEEFGYTLRDGDGDESSAALKICVEDTYPRPPEGSGTLAFTVDEDGLPAGIGNSDSPNDVLATSASFAGNIPFIPGADPVTIELSIGNGGDTGLKTLSGQTILGAWDVASKTLIGYIAGTDPSDAGNQIFKMTVTNDATGAFTFELLKPIKHADGGQDDNTENEPDPQFVVNVQIEDKDCDVAFTTVTIGIDDDMPVICEATRPNFRLATDETLGGGSDVDPDPGHVRENDEDVIDVPFALEFAPRIGEAQADAANLFTFNAGADGLQSVGFALTITGGGFTGLIDTQTGTPIVLVPGAGGIVLGKANGGAGATVFAFHVDGDGDVTMAQYRAVNHGQDGNNHDSEIFMAPGALAVTFSVTDKDGDTASLSKDISGLVSIDDDGPKFKKVDFGHDEDGDRIDEDNLPIVGNGDFAPGDDQGGIHTDGTIEFDFGSDKAGSLSIESLTVTDSAGNPINLANLHTSDGRDITITPLGPDANGVVTWAAVVAAGETGAGQPVFTLTLDTSGANIGAFNFDLHQALEHPYNDNNFKNNGPDTTYEDNLKFDFTIKATDGDTDHTTGHLTFNIDDDSPNADKVKIKLTGGEGNDSMLVHDETAGVQNKGNGSGAADPDASGIDEDDISPAPADYAAFEAAKGLVTNIGYAQTNVAISLNNGGGDAEDAIGADRPGEVSGLSLTNSSGGNITNGTATNLFDTATGNRIYLYTEVVGSETFVVGRVGNAGSANANGAISFALHVSEGGTIEVGQYRAIKHPNTGSDDDAVTLLNSNSNGAVVYITVTVTDADGDSVKVTKPLDGGNHGAGSIVFQDDGPTANADVDNVKEAGPTVATGNVITGADGGLGSDANTDDGVADTAGTDGLKSITWASVVENGAVDYIQGTYGKLHVDAAGNYKYELDLTDPDTKNLTKGQIVQETFSYTIEDKDGDKASTTLKINVEGSNEPPHIDLDPRDPNTDDETAVVSDEGLPGGNPDNVGFPSDDTDSKTFTGTLVVSDPDVGDTLTVAMQPGAFPAWTFSDGALVSWSLSGDGLTLTGTAGGNPAITVAITPAGVNSYDYTVTLHQPLDHPDPLTEDELSFNVIVRVTDSAGEFDEATLTVQVEDDSPRITLVDESLVLGVDESVGGALDFDDASAIFPLDGGAIEGDEVGASAVFTALGTVIGFDSGNGAALFSYTPGADGEDSHAFGLKVVNGGLTTLVDTQTGQLVQLVDVGGGIIQGRTVGSDLLVLAFSINAGTGTVEMAQYRAVDHGTDQPASYPDEVTYLNTGNLSVLAVTLEVTDKDGDKATAERDISHSISIDDDGPKADLIKLEVDKGGDGKLVHDETAGVQNGGNNSGATDPDASGQDEDDVAVRPAEFAALEGANPALVPVGYASVAVNIDLSGGGANPNAAYGSDGPGTTTVALTDGAGNAFIGQQSTLIDTASNQAIFLFSEGNLVVGRVGGGGGDIAFALSVDGNSLDVAQYRAIQHPNAATDDESVTLLGVSTQFSSLIFAKVTVTDDDGDSVSKLVPFNGVDGNPAIVFQDDGPTLKDGTVQGSAEEDDINNAFSIGNNEDGSVGKDVALGSLTSLISFGTDGAAAGGGFSLDPAAIATLEAQGLSSKGVALTYGIVGDTLTASAGLQTVFTLKVEPNGNYTFTLVDQLDHHPIPLADNVEGFLTINLGGVVKATDGDGDSVSLTDNFSVKVQDDIPTAFNPADKSTGNNAGVVVVGDLDFQGHVGTDEPASITFTGFTNGDAAKDVNGDPIKSQGEDVFLYGDGTGVITGKTADNDVIFTVTLSPGADTYSFNLNREIDDGGGVVFTNLSGGKAGQKEWARIDNLDTDLLITPLDQVAGTVNTDTNDIGVADQFIDNGEGVRIDFVKSPAGDESVQNGYTFANHYLVNETSFSIIDIGGGGTASLKIRIVKADDDTNLVTDTDAQDVVAALSAAGIKIDNNAGAVPTITDLGGGYFQIDGLDKDDTITVTGDEAYNRLEITGLDGKQFSIGELAIGTIVSGDPVTMNFDVKLTDKDGDYTTADFNVTVVDQPVTITDVTAKIEGGDTVVDEKGLPTRAGEPAGSGEIVDGDAGNNSDGSETNTGFFTIKAPDGVKSLTVEGQSIVANDAYTDNVKITTSLGELTITDYDAVTGKVSYSYTLKDNANHSAGGGTNPNQLFDDFDVALVDKDNDTATTVLSVQILDDLPTARPDTDSVTEDAVPNTALGNVINGTGTNEGAGGSGTDTPGADGASVTKITGAGGSDTGFDAGVLEVAGKYGTLKIEADGDYTYTLNNANPDVNGLNDGGKLVDEFTYRLTDGDGDTSDSTLKITINGDSDNFVPNAVDDTNNAVDVATNYQLMLVLDRSGSMDEIVPNSGGKTRFEVARDSLIALIEKFQGSTSGTVNIKLVLFNNTSDFAGGSNASTFISADAAITFLAGLSATFGDNGTDYDAALWDAKQGIDNATWISGDPNTVSRAYWVSDGRPTEVGNSDPENSEFPGGNSDNEIDAVEQGAWEATLDAKGVKSIAIGIGSDIVGDAQVADQLARIAHDPGVANSGLVQIIDDINALTAALVSTVPGPVNGNLLGNDTAGDPSDPLTGGVVTIIDLSDDGGAVAATQDLGTQWKIETAYGILIVDKVAPGTYVYTPKPGSEGKTDTFQYTIKDTINSDTDSAVLSISIPTGTVVNGTAGDDTKAAGLGNDTVNGGNGNDVLWGGEGNDIVNGDAGNDRVYGGAGNDELKGGADNDTYIVVAGDGKDTITDTAGTADSLVVIGGTFFDPSRSGNDLVVKYGATGLTDQVTVAGHFAGAGGNVETITIVGGAFAGTYALNKDGSGTIDGDANNEMIVGAAGVVAETFNASGGNDLVFAQGGNDTVNGGDGNDRLLGQDGTDQLNGGNDNDTLTGGAGTDSLNGGSGNDTLIGDVDAVVDTLNGGLGNDTFIVGEAIDVVVEAGGEGTDTVQASVTYTITDTDVENLTLTGGASINGTGNSSANTLTGNSGDNKLEGLGGNDTLIGGVGSDDLQGGNDADTYRFSAGHGIDTITETGGTDTVNLTSNVGPIDVQTDGTNMVIKYGNITLTDQVTINNSAVENLVVDDDPYTGSYTIINDLSGNATGDGSDNVIAGRTGNNTLNGGGGEDLIFGGAGDDTLDGGEEGDLLVGGVGNDTYNVSDGDDRIFITSSLDGKDVITAGFDTTDAGAGGQDFIDLDQVFDSLGVASADRDARVNISTSGGNTLVKVNIDGGGFDDAGDLLITITGVTLGISKGAGGDDDVQYGTL